MSGKVKQLKKIADPTIEAVLQQYLDECAAAKKTGKSTRKEAIELFQHSMNGYAYQTLSKEETALYDHYSELEGDDCKNFCQLFGPEKIPENVREFVGYFLIRKVMASATFLGKAAKEIEKLCLWLEAKGFINEEVLGEAAENAAEAGKKLPRAEKACTLLFDMAQEADFEGEIVDEGYMDITKVSSDSIWLCPFGGKEFGPIFLPKKVTELLEVGWEINCAVAKHRDKLVIVEVGNIYPH